MIFIFSNTLNHLFARRRHSCSSVELPSLCEHVYWKCQTKWMKSINPDERSSLTWSRSWMQIHKSHVMIGRFSTNFRDHLKPRKTLLFPIEEETPQRGLKGFQLVRDVDGTFWVHHTVFSFLLSVFRSNQWLHNRPCKISVTHHVRCLSGKKKKHNWKAQLWEQQCRGEMQN